jgi:hypothetical protein
MSSLIPHLAETAPFMARALLWLFVFDVLLVIGTVIGGVALMKFRARLTVEEARRAAEATPYRQVHDGLVRGRRGLVSAVIITAIGVLVAWAAGRLTRDLFEFFVVIMFAGIYGPCYVAIRVFEELFRLTADRVDELLKQSLTSSTNREGPGSMS